MNVKSVCVKLFLGFIMFDLKCGFVCVCDCRISGDLAFKEKPNFRLSSQEFDAFPAHPHHMPWHDDHDRGPAPPDRPPPIQYAGVPDQLRVYPLPMEGSDHELKFNVSWGHPIGPPALDYSLEIRSMSDTVDCKTPMCYEYNIPGNAHWWIAPAFTNPVAETCAVRPGCSYLVLLTAHPWDGHTTAEKLVKLDECVSGVCSCAHSPRLPPPSVSAYIVVMRGDIFANVSWTLPPPSFPQRLPKDLMKHSYFVSIGKQMVTDAHPSPWYANTVSRRVDTDGLVAFGDTKKWFLLPINERGIDRSDRGNPRLTLDVKLLARVNLIDNRGCIGPAGNATAYDPDQNIESSYVTYVLWALAGCVCMGIMLLVLIAGARAVKKALIALRPAPADVLEPLRYRPAWLPLQSRPNENQPRGQTEFNPVYDDKKFETEEDGDDEWEVSSYRVQLGALIGSGAFGRVHLAQLNTVRGEVITVAAKMLSEHASEEEMQDFLREITMLKHVGSHKHVIRLIGCCTKRAPLVALLEHAPRGDLLSLLRAARGKRKIDQESIVTRRADSNNTPRVSEADTEYTNISDYDPPLEDKLYSDDEDKPVHHYVAEPALHLDGSTMRDYALQVALGMRHLADRGITHRDLAARNILVDAAGLLKVADFGLSRTGVYVHTRSNPVPLRWLAPEAIQHSQYCSASDVWAFAVLLWEIATLGGFPYADLSNHQVPAFLSGGGRLPKPGRASPRLYQLMVECWSDCPENRPTFEQIVLKLTAQRQLYVDLDCILPPLQNDLFDDFNFNTEVRL